jgi:putative flippase GtrA
MKSSIYKFLITGIISFLVDYGLTVILHYLFNVEGYLASAIGFSVTFLINFLLNKQWVFQKNKSHQLTPHKQLLLFFGLAIFNLLLSTSFVGVASMLHVEVVVSKAMIAVLIAGWNFPINRMIIFAEKK